MRTLEITTYIGCGVKCSYCPQETLRKSYVGHKIMDLSNFSKILDNTPKDVRIDFSGFSEIFGHPEGSKFILLAFERGFQIVLYTTLKGFTDYDVKILSGVKFNEVCFHKYEGAGDVFETKVNRFKLLVQDGRIAEITPQWKWSRAGNVWHTNYKPGAFACLFAGKDFDHNVVLPNGDVVLCCQDYGLKHVLGNLYTTKFNDLDRSKIISMSFEEDNNCICRFCELAQG